MVFGTAVEASTVYPGLDISCTNSAQCQHSRSAPCVCSGRGGQAQPHAPGCAPSHSTQQLQAPSLHRAVLTAPLPFAAVLLPHESDFPLCQDVWVQRWAEQRKPWQGCLVLPLTRDTCQSPVFPSTHVSQQKACTLSQSYAAMIHPLQEFGLKAKIPTTKRSFNLQTGGKRDAQSLLLMHSGQSSCTGRTGSAQPGMTFLSGDA